MNNAKPRRRRRNYRADEVIDILHEGARAELDRRIAAESASLRRESQRFMPQGPPVLRRLPALAARAALLTFALGAAILASVRLGDAVSTRRMVVRETELLVARSVLPVGGAADFAGDVFEVETGYLIDSVMPLGGGGSWVLPPESGNGQ
jgi:anti-sigma factor RsiW